MSARGVVLTLAAVAAIGAIWWASGLGRIPADPRRVFEADEIARANAYETPKEIGYAASSLLGLGILAVLAFTRPGATVLAPLRSWPRPLAAGAAAVITIVVVALARLPLAYWRTYLHERAWGFSTQSPAGWLSDWGKGLGVSSFIGALATTGFVALVVLLPRAWPAAAAAGAALLVVVLTFLAPVVLEPVFNRFTPLPDRALADHLRALADRAGVPVREVLVADASRRTTKENAYVSGFGTTKRLVLYDTLLEKADRDEVELVTAHELGHRRLHHVEIGTVVGALSAAAMVVVVWLLVRAGITPRAGGVADPRLVPFLLLVVGLLSVLTLPPGNWLSRRFEAAADRFALRLTGNRDAYVRTERGLAIRNLADLDPDPVTYRFLFTHPAPAERIALAGPTRRAAGVGDTAGARSESAG